MRSALVLLALSSCLPVRSQPPSPRPPEYAQDNKGKAKGKQNKTSDNRGDANSISSAIDKLTSEVTSWKQQQAATPQNNDTSTDWWTGLSTILTAEATAAIAFLAYFQWRTMKGHEKTLKAMDSSIERGLAETKRAADAARDSADAAKQAFVALHCPRLGVRFISADDTGHVQPMSGRFLVFNSGSTDAILKSIYSEVFVGNQLLPIAPSEGRAGRAPKDVTIVPGGYAELPCPTAGPTSEPADYMEHKALRTLNIFLIGWVDYADRSGRMRKVGFCRRYDRSTKRFDKQTDPDYEYDD